MRKLLTLSDLDELKRVIRQNLSLIAFGTPWSSPCRDQHEMLVDFARKYNGMMLIARVDVEKHPRIADKCTIQTVPTLIVYQKTREVIRLVGLQSIETLSASMRAIQLSDINNNAAGRAVGRLQFLPHAEG